MPPPHHHSRSRPKRAGMKTNEPNIKTTHPVESNHFDTPQGGDGGSNGGGGRPPRNRNQNSEFDENWNRRFPFNDKFYKNLSNKINFLFSKFDINKNFDQHSETKITSELLHFLDGKTINLNQAGLNKVISFSLLENQGLNPTEKFSEKKIGSDFIVEVFEANDSKNSSVFLIQSKKVIDEKVPKLEIETDKKFNKTPTELDRELSTIDEKERCDYKSISQALTMICASSKEQSFFLLLHDQTDSFKFIFAEEIYKWRKSWFNELESRDSKNGFNGIEQLNNKCKPFNLSEFFSNIILKEPIDKKSLHDEISSIGWEKKLTIKIDG